LGGPPFSYLVVLLCPPCDAPAAERPRGLALRLGIGDTAEPRQRQIIEHDPVRLLPRRRCTRSADCLRSLDGLERSLRDCESWSPGRYEVLLAHWEPSSEMRYTHWGVAIKHPDGSLG